VPLWKDPQNGKYRYQFQHQGRRHSKTVFLTQKAARTAMETHREKLETLIQTPPSPPTRCVSVSEPLTLEAMMVKYLRLAERAGRKDPILPEDRV
jgi:radical SAM superfamily enzyme YgiQ (UPF0313 family)